MLNFNLSLVQVCRRFTRSDILTQMTMNMIVLWDVVLSNLVDENQYFREVCCLHLS
jgi:hypothetical protein